MSLLSLVIGYLLGSVSFSYLAGKLLKGIDIRQHGSGNAGATNTMRVLGKGPGIAVLLLDMIKGMAAVWIGSLLSGGDSLFEVLAGVSVIIGHNWPIFFGFRGGKGIATTVGVMATLAFLPTLYAGIIAVLTIVLTRYVSLGSLLFTALLPIFIWFMDLPNEFLVLSLLLFVFAWVKHRSNIVKLLNGKENKLGAKKQA
ncbi:MULTISPECIES: glycerol-3-phosphate 1-O-acyltransferase PlsY [unclassified Paenibacillus]|uniref:glycerol-3-phosphate 1-O-acyltransferase PlsY n=1 Tax=unclassified Paenibacillus TaxID=185978 RepID=UPI001AE2F731|nr:MULTISPECIES: glycerol-3-phosphate 1-O-acyltransferase PlsY [unclassified Paenibacillus]MBP1155246.1 glycerol-3-phosphate acyltransferase PlsY [Paenibacillus sp. PvP091]MBP1169370.1 glycerol-3-phosphate acyltransferase PlsY [Paenibacillus sp. PvR098]MBP2440398.1 glycerol-3-phosphate acyltransferase PlsY [Paenibacillus sp. PvP052]